MPIKEREITKKFDSFYETYHVQVDVAFTTPNEAETFLKAVERALEKYPIYTKVYTQHEVEAD